MQIRFDEEGDAYYVRDLDGTVTLARLVEAGDGTCKVDLDPDQAGRRGLPVSSNHDDLTAAQGFLIDLFDSYMEMERAGFAAEPTPAPAPRAPVSVTYRSRRATGNSGPRFGPQPGTHYARADAMLRYFHDPIRGVDRRDETPAHRECYELVHAATNHFHEAQGLGRTRFPGSHQLEMSHRGKGKRALDKAAPLYKALRAVETSALNELYPTRVHHVLGKDIDVESVGGTLLSKGYAEIGEGHHAVVYARPGGDVVVRVGNGCDGFVRYADYTRGVLAGEVGRHAPVIFDLAVEEEDCTIAVVERLQPLPPEGEAPDLDVVVDQAIALMEGDTGPTEELDARYPRLRGFVADLRRTLGSLDTRRENLMLRVGQIVVTDPQGKGLFAHEVDAFRGTLPFHQPFPTALPEPVPAWWDDPARNQEPSP